MNMNKSLEKSGDPDNFGSGINKLIVGSSETTEVLRTNRIHVVREELGVVPSGEYSRHRQQSRGDAMILAGQRRLQCVAADLALYVIGEKVNSQVINIFLKNLV